MKNEQEKFIKSDVNFDNSILDNVTDIQYIKENGSISVYKIKSKNRYYYLKSTDDANEITRTKLAHRISKNNEIIKTPYVLNIPQEKLTKFATIYNLITPKDSNTWFLTNDINSKFRIMGLIDEEPTHIIKTTLHGQPITASEQKKVLRDIKRMNAAGIEHGDLLSNTFYERTADGVLHVSVIDFEPWSANLKDRPSDIRTISDFFTDALAHKTALLFDPKPKEQKSDKFNTATKKLNNNLRNIIHKVKSQLMLDK